MVSKVKLIKKTYTVDTIGQKIATETETEVLADVLSISQSEFAASGALGFKPLLQFQLWQREYSNEDILEYEDERYQIYRTYNNPNGRTELYAQKDVGI